MAQPPFTQADLERVKEIAHKLGGDVLAQFEGHPFAALFALATLTIASAQVAVITDTSFSQLMELVSLHYRAAQLGLVTQELEEQLGHPLNVKLTEPV